MPVIVLSKCFENRIVGKYVRVREVMVEDERTVAHVSVGGANADELYGNKIGIDGRDWIGDDLGFDLV